jgi:predicted GNAT superfamily acetyltransferase
VHDLVFDTGDFDPLVEMGSESEPVCDEQQTALKSEKVFIEIPADIHALEERNFALAVEWRSATRSAFTKAFANGYVAVGFVRKNRGGRYLLIRGKGTGDFLSE